MCICVYVAVTHHASETVKGCALFGAKKTSTEPRVFACVFKWLS